MRLSGSRPAIAPSLVVAERFPANRVVITRERHITHLYGQSRFRRIVAGRLAVSGQVGKSDTKPPVIAAHLITSKGRYAPEGAVKHSKI